MFLIFYQKFHSQIAEFLHSSQNSEQIVSTNKRLLFSIHVWEDMALECRYYDGRGYVLTSRECTTPNEINTFMQNTRKSPSRALLNNGIILILVICHRQHTCPKGTVISIETAIIHNFLTFLSCIDDFMKIQQHLSANENSILDFFILNPCSFAEWEFPMDFFSFYEQIIRHCCTRSFEKLEKSYCLDLSRVNVSRAINFSFLIRIRRSSDFCTQTLVMNNGKIMKIIRNFVRLRVCRSLRPLVQYRSQKPAWASRPNSPLHRHCFPAYSPFSNLHTDQENENDLFFSFYYFYSLFYFSPFFINNVDETI